MRRVGSLIGILHLLMGLKYNGAREVDLKKKVIVKFNREEALACTIALDKEKKPYKWQQDALAKLDKARNGISETARSIRIEIDHLPFRELNPNSREHWAVKARAVRASREEIGWLAKVQWHDDKPMVKARISYQFHTKDKRHRDMDNLLSSAKAWQDGLIDAGVIFYDDSQHLEIGQCNVMQGDTEQSIVIVDEILEILR